MLTRKALVIIRQQEHGSEFVEFRQSLTETRSGGLTIRRRTTPKVMYNTDGGETDPVRAIGFSSFGCPSYRQRIRILQCVQRQREIPLKD